MAPMVNYFNMPIGELNSKSVLQISDQDFHGHFYCFTGTLFEFFHGKRFFFHGWNLTKIFTGTSCISRALFGQKLVFFTGGFFFSREKKTLTLGTTFSKKPEFNRFRTQMWLNTQNLTSLQLRCG